MNDILGPVIRTVAPKVGTALGGPLAGLATEIVLDVLGVPKNATPEQVTQAATQAVTNVEDTKIKLAEAEERFKTAAVQAMAQLGIEQSKQLNETIRAEIAQGVSWYHWRHLLGYVPLIIGVEIAALLPLIVIGKITAADMGAIITAITPFMAIVAGLLGYVASDSTNLKTAAITGEQPKSLVNRVIDAVKKK